MSFCPSKDIHSIYLDNELPAEIKVKYEAHLNSCEECQKQLSQMKAIKESFVSEKNEVVLDDAFLEESFARLQLKMNYSNNIKKIKKNNSVFNSSRIFYAISGVAAAAVFALIIPLRLKNVSNVQAPIVNFQTSNSVVPYSISTSGFNHNVVNNVSLGSGKGMLISDNMKGSVLYSGNSKDRVRRLNAKKTADSLLDNITVIKPEIDDKTISIRITVPGFDSVPVTTEIELPVNVITGQN